MSIEKTMVVDHPSNKLDLLSIIIKAREAFLVVFIVLLTALTGLLIPNFISATSIRDILLNVSIIALLAVGQSLVILMRQIDLSVSSTVGIVAFFIGYLYTQYPEMPILVAMLIGIFVGVLLGGINAILITFGKVPALVTTLGTLYVFRGINYAWVHGRQINAADVPASFLAMGNEGILGIPYLVMIVMVVIVIAAVYLKNFRSGREYYAIGSNPLAAELAGIFVQRRISIGFIVSGAIAGLAGVLWLARFGTVDATAGLGIELQVITAAVVGGVAISGGVGTITGAVLGALLLTVFGSALVFLKVPAFWQQAIQGALLLIAIGADAYLARVHAANERSKKGHV